MRLFARLQKSTLRHVAAEGVRYVAASACAFIADFAAYVALIRLAGWNYLVAAPVGFALGLGVVYWLSVRWVFRARRLADARMEFGIFAGIGLFGMALNEAILYAAVAQAGLSYELAKFVSAAVVFSANFVLRKLLLFTPYGTHER